MLLLKVPGPPSEINGQVMFWAVINDERRFNSTCSKLGLT